jgi:hypothetical protein
MSNQQVLSFLHELRSRTMPAYHTKPAPMVGPALPATRRPP